MKKVTFLILAVLFAGKLLQAQSIDDGRKFLYYDRFTSAKNAFTKLVGSNPKDANAIYWLGQTMLRQDSVAGAKALYQKALQDGVNDPMIWVGMGQVELLEGKKDAAKQRFEQAITTSKTKKGDNPDILNAIGRANASGSSTTGDPAYAIELLKRAAERNPKDPDIYINMGINYLKLGNDRGGDAYEAFNNALRIDPNNALAKFRLGRIFLSQGNVPKFEEYFTGATTSDPAFAPAYLEMYNYYANRDVNKAREYLDKYVANTDKDCSVEYFSAEYLFRAGKYQESLNAAKAMENGACKDFPRLKVLYAYNYDRLKDSVQAKANIESYLSSADTSKVQPSDYVFAGQLLSKFPGSEVQSAQYLERAIASDTVKTNQVDYINTATEMYTKAGQYDQAVTWYRRLAAIKPDLSNRDLYLYADAAIRANKLQTADSISSLYIAKFPDQEFGYSLKVRGAKANDPDSTTGSAFPAVEEYIAFLSKDSTKNIAKIKAQYYYMAALYADKLKDYPKAIEITDKILALDPQDTFGLQAGKALRAAVDKAKNPGKAAPAKAPAKTTTAKPAVKKKG